jgi:aldose 1-epimerase
LQINAEAMTPVDSDLIPTGVIVPVAGTRFDFRRAKPINSADYDCNFVLAAPVAATLIDPASGRRLDVRTTEPGMQLYTGNPRGVCLETQHYPDSPNRTNFPSVILRPGSQYRSQTVFAFGIEEGS